MNIDLDVERGLAIRAQMDGLKAELKGIEARLHEAGLGSGQVELEDPEREGRQFLARSAQHVVPVVFTADLLVGAFAEASLLHQRAAQCLPPNGVGANLLGQFYRRTIKHENLFDSGKKFRARARNLLGSEAPRFITACVARDRHGLAKSAIKVEWNRAERVG